MDSQLATLLSEHHIRLTTPRRQIFDELTRAHEPLSIVQLTKLLPDADRVSIYRTIELFTRLGITTAVNYGWKQRYELASPLKPHHHHLFCTSCSRHIEIHSKHLEALIETIGKEQDFTPRNHHFEITGTCNQCRATSPN